MPNTTAQRFGQDESLEPAVPYPGARIGYLLPGDPDVPHVVDGPHGIQRREVDYAANDDGFLGSPGGGKTTLDVIYLWPGMQTGNLELRDMAEVRQISRGRAGHGPRYEVAYRDLRGGGSHVLRADHVVVAAGTLNTLKLLMTSRHAGGLTGMPRLGLNFGTNGDFVGFWDRCSADDLTPGLPTRGGFRLRGAEGSPIFGGGAFPSSADYPLPGRLKRRIGRSQLVFGMGVDAMDGRASYDGVRFRLSFDTAGSPIFAEIWNAADIISVRTGARLRYRRNAMTVHPMGGAGLGRDETSGVVGGDGTVFGHPGLYVTDAAVFPTSPGAPPSLSIAAWSEYVAAGILEREGCR